MAIANKRAAEINGSQSWLAVYTGQQCVGHVLNSGKSGWRAYDIDDKIIETFPTFQAAVVAVLNRGSVK
jgi:hypothetical protein